jgi:2Fe-2S iron-sulfur cluster binding domain
MSALNLAANALRRFPQAGAFYLQACSWRVIYSLVMSPVDGMLALSSDHDAAQAPDCSVVPNLATGAARAPRSDVACGIRRMIVRSRFALINMRLDEATRVTLQLGRLLSNCTSETSGRNNMVSLKVNGLSVEANAAPDTPLLWVLRDHLGLTGTKFGCGIGQCGACTVHLDGNPVHSCVLPISAVKVRSRQSRLSARPRPGSVSKPRGSRWKWSSAATVSRGRSCRPQR